MSVPADVGPTSRIYISSRLRLHYADWGNEGAPTLVLLHGGRDHCRSWDWIARAFRKDWHVIAPDLRGHGDSAWSPDGCYDLEAHISDLAQLIHQKNIAPATIVGHSFGGAVASRYAGIYPANVRKLVLIEGLGWSPQERARREETPMAERLREWIEERRALAGRQPRRYATIDEAFDRMRQANGNLSVEQARHLTLHGISQNEDGSYSWKFDNYLRDMSPVDITTPELQDLWTRIACPTLLAYGKDSWASNPERDGRAAFFSDARVIEYEGAGHWLHHDRQDAFVADLRSFFAA